MLSVTVGDRGVALVKKFRYLRAKVSWTGSFISIVTWGSRLGSGKGSCRDSRPRGQLRQRPPVLLPG